MNINKTNHNISNKKGFTLIELLIVLIIIAVISSIAVPVYLHLQNRAREASTKTEMYNIAMALELYASDNDVYPDVESIGSLAAELSDYIDNMKTVDAWGNDYKYTGSVDNYTLVSAGIDKIFDTDDDIIFYNGLMTGAGRYKDSAGNNSENTTTPPDETTAGTGDVTSTTEETTTTVNEETTTTLPNYPLWSADTAYSGGTYVIYDGKVFYARFWTKNHTPGLLESPWQEITDEWRFFNAYNEGDTVIYNGKTYKAKWNTQDSKPGSVGSAWELLD